MERIETDVLYGLSYQNSEGIHVYRFSDVQRQTLDVWAELIRQHDAQAVENGQHVRSLHDLRGYWVTPYMLAKCLEIISNNSPDLRESVAILGNHVAGSFFRASMRRFPSSVLPSMQFFSQETMALMWLNQRLEELGP